MLKHVRFLLMRMIKAVKKDLQENKLDIDGMSQQDKVALNDGLVNVNTERAVLFVILFMICELVHIVMILITKLYNEYFYYLIGSIALFAIAFAYLCIINHIKAKAKVYAKFGRAAYFGFWTIFACAAVPIVILDISVRGSISNYLIILAAITIIPILFVREILVIVLVPMLCIVSAGILIAVEPYLIVQIISLSFAVIAISQFRRIGYMRSFISKTKLEGNNELLAVQADTDALTNLFNRRGLEKKIDLIWPYCVRFRNNMSVIMIDIDYFKEYNDTFGHVAGDDCLQAISQCILKSVRRATDVVARIGGEEFLVFLYGVTPQNALALTRKLKHSIENMQIDDVGDGRITVSMGLSCIVPDERADFKSLYEQADKALYAAKNSGRNCIVYNGEVYS